MSWDAITRWVADHLHQQVQVSMTAGEVDGSTFAVMASSGILGYGGGDWTLIDPAPGQQLSCRVGDAHVLILEGAVEDVEASDSLLATERA